MNQTSKPTITTTNPATPAPFSVGPSSAITQAKGTETKALPARTQAVRRTVRFELDAPNAWSVYLVGTFNDWRIGETPLFSIGGGKWAKELPLAPGRYEYRFMVNGYWMDAPKAKAYVANPHGGRNAVLQVE